MPNERKTLVFPAFSTITCPDCEDIVTHLTKVDTFSTGRDRRLAVELVFGCENCRHTFGLVFSNNRGNTNVGVTR